MGARIVLSLDDQIVGEAELTKPVTLLGRHPDCDVVVDHPAISGRHLLLRIVNHTVYAEDLASTNGTRVNGLAASHQVLHHLDVIEVGRHKLHYFDESMLAGKVGGLDKTVLTDYERTLLTAHAPEAARPAKAAAQGDAFSRTTEMTAMPEVTDAPGPDALALRVVEGEEAGRVIALRRANTMIGTPGADAALVVRRGDAYFLARFSGTRAPRLNRRELGPGTHRIAPQDVIDVGGSRFEVIAGA